MVYVISCIIFLAISIYLKVNIEYILFYICHYKKSLNFCKKKSNFSFFFDHFFSGASWGETRPSLLKFFVEKTVWRTLLLSCFAVHLLRITFLAERTLKSYGKAASERALLLSVAFLVSHLFISLSLSYFFWGILFLSYFWLITFLFLLLSSSNLNFFCFICHLPLFLISWLASTSWFRFLSSSPFAFFFFFFFFLLSFLHIPSCLPHTCILHHLTWPLSSGISSSFSLFVNNLSPSDSLLFSFILVLSFLLGLLPIRLHFGSFVILVLPLPLPAQTDRPSAEFSFREERGTSAILCSPWNSEN